MHCLKLSGAVCPARRTWRSQLASRPIYWEIAMKSERSTCSACFKTCRLSALSLGGTFQSGTAVMCGATGTSRVANEIQAILFPGLTSSDRRYKNKQMDIDHLVGHFINRRDIFITDDNGIWKKKGRSSREPWHYGDVAGGMRRSSGENSELWCSGVNARGRAAINRSGGWSGWLWRGVKQVFKNELLDHEAAACTGSGTIAATQAPPRHGFTFVC